MAFLKSIAFSLLLYAYHVSAVTVTYNWNITWVNANPDGLLTRPVIGINGKWPCPPISVNVNDIIIVNVLNQLGNQTTSIHWHGQPQTGSNAMDGPVAVTQCPIPPGKNYTYQFTAANAGTYWYHSHNSQYPDGLRGPLIVKDPNSPYIKNYTSEIVLTLSDWYHGQMPSLIATYLSPTANPNGAEPIPWSALLNDAQNIKLPVQPSTTYLVRVISMAAFAQTYLHFDQHTMTIVEADGVYTHPQPVDTLYVATAQRYSVLLTTKSSTTTNYAFLGSMDSTKFDSVPSCVHPNVTGYLVYNSNAALPAMPTVGSFDVFDDYNLVPYDNQKLYWGSTNSSFTLNLDFFNRDGQNRAGFNNVTYLMQKVPTLYTAMTTGADAANPVVYGPNANAFIVNDGMIVEIVINNYDGGSHPMHIHGHTPQIVARNAGVYAAPGYQHPNQGSPWPAGVTNASQMGYNPNAGLPAIPMRRDTWLIAPNGYTVIRFQTYNPGVWLIHCHMEWHVEAGLTATMIVAPQILQSTQKIPPAALSMCAAMGIPTAGNAAGNTVNHFDLTGAYTTAPANPRGAMYP